MQSASKTLYRNGPECLMVVFNLQHPKSKERLQREHAAWHGYAHVENLTAEASVLIVRPGAATRLAA